MNSKFEIFLDPDINEEDFNNFVELIKHPEFLEKLSPLPDGLDITEREQVENLYLYFKLNTKMDYLNKELDWAGQMRDNEDKADDFRDKIDEARQHVFNLFNNRFKDPELYLQFADISNSLYIFGNKFLNRDDLLLLNIKTNKNGCLTVFDIDGTILFDGARVYNDEEKSVDSEQGDDPFGDFGDHGDGEQGDDPFGKRGNKGRGKGDSELTL